MPAYRRKARSQFTVPLTTEYSTKQFSERTWSDFERLFETHPAPGAYPCWCMHCHWRGPEVKSKGDSRAKLIERNRREKKTLVKQGRSHGILVYAHGEPLAGVSMGRVRNYRGLTTILGIGSSRMETYTSGCGELPASWSTKSFAAVEWHALP